MFKKLLQITFISLIVFSILAPPVWSLCMDEGQSIVWSDSSSEEEQQEKAEKELEEKILQWGFENTMLSVFSNTEVTNNHYQENYLDFLQPIVLPPPELKS